MKRALLAASLLVLCASGCAVAQARSAGPTHGVLAYAKPYVRLQSYTGSHENVWLAGPDGRHPRLLGIGVQPSVSPDGSLVAFTRGATVFVVRSAGGAGVLGAGAVPLATLPSVDDHASPPVWAPDSRRLGIVDTSGRLWVLDTDTGSETVVCSRCGQDGSFSFSPDSRRIVYEQHGVLYVVSARGGRPQRLTGTGGSARPVWGRLGILFAHSPSDIWLTSGAPGSAARRLTQTNAPLFPLFVSADGTKLLAGAPFGELWSVDVRTGATRMLSGRVAGLVPEGLSRDGGTVLVGVGCGGEFATPYGDVETIPFAGGQPRVVVRGACQASWSAG